MENTLDRLKNWFIRLILPLVKFASAEPNMEDKSKAFYADQLINNPIYEQIMKELRVKYTDFWLNSAFNEKDRREEYYQYLRALNQIDWYIKSHITNIKYKEMINFAQQSSSREAMTK
jgi:hypothetical protein